MSKEAESQQDPVIIKKYANRRLYNTDTSTYVTLDDLAAMVRSERDFVVYDAKSGEDLTHAILTQIIVDQESKGQNLLPIRFLRQLIRFYGDSIERLVPSYLEFSLDKLTREQDRYRKQFANAFGAGAFDAMQEQARQNFAMFEKAMGVFTPFNAGGPGAPTQTPEAENGSQEPQAASSERTTSETDEIAALKAQLSDMQQKLDQLSRRSS
ncbi:MAG: polyhydroxyalkanoate synthesis repressor PhaR [Hyphomicrobiales bacterium]|nr:polyhydroxyalkanoate synthesis repressor PhaR [Hyphomicrobiales bacterium]